jgi:hypothetical protein
MTFPSLSFSTQEMSKCRISRILDFRDTEVVSEKFEETCAANESQAASDPTNPHTMEESTDEIVAAMEPSECRISDSCDFRHNLMIFTVEVEDALQSPPVGRPSKKLRRQDDSSDLSDLPPDDNEATNDDDKIGMRNQRLPISGNGSSVPI